MEGKLKKRILLAVAYDGTDYAGFQAQKSGVPTIEGELNRVLTELTGQPVEVIGASRTDAGVHAYCNLAVFDTESRIPPEKFAYAVNVRLPEQICVPVSMEVAEDFHPRRCSTVKTYEYRIYNAQMPDPMKRLYSYFSRYHFDVDAMREAAEYLVGEHDFKSFCSTYSSAKTTVREVLSVQVEEVPCSMSYKGYTASSQTGAAADGVNDWTDGRSGMPREIVIRVSGRGFLYNMVRIIAGTLMEVGRGFKKPGDIPEILQACDRRAAGATAPACGLTLVRYEVLEPGYEMVFGSRS
jgi:tRNA pseudouridine38-40 synthase